MIHRSFIRNFKPVTLIAVLLAVTNTVSADDWPAWRGPRGDGISLEVDVPLSWSTDSNIAWRTELPGVGRSSPIVSGNSVFLTTGVADDLTRRVLCLDRKDGRILWNTVVHQGPGGKMHQDNTMASSTPVTDGESVFAVFVDDSGMTVAALDNGGNIRWKTSPGSFFSNHGFAASPVVFGPGVIVNGHQDGTAFVIMLDKSTGKELWRYTPAVNLRSFSTPVLIQHAGQHQLILTGSQQTVALDPTDGTVIWYAAGPSEKFVCTPSIGHGMVFSFAGSPDKKALAVRLGGQGDVSETHVVWRNERGMPYVPSPLLMGDYLHIVNDLGVYSCIEPKTGEVLHTARALGSTYSSPVAAAGRIYMFEDTGRCTIFENRPGFHVMSRNDLSEEVYTTPAISNGHIFVRTVNAMVCIGEGQ
ncbi:MAG: PQQ-binding-like beta-propeller repeat protein [Planctomycetia bacterium]